MLTNDDPKMPAAPQTVGTDLRTFWQAQLERYEQTGGSRKAFCRAEQLNYDQFQYWYRKLGAKAASPVKPIPVTLASTTSKPDVSNPSLCTLEFSGGQRLHVHDWALVDRLLARLS